MSETLVDAKTSLKKIASIIVNLSGLNSDYIPKLRIQPENILEELEKYGDGKNVLINTLKSNYEEINTLKNKITQNQRDIGKFEEENAEFVRNRQELETKIQESRNKTNEVKETINTNDTFIKKEKFVESYELRVAAMKALIKRKYINSLLYQFIKALQVGSSLDLKNILIAIDMKEEQARKIITKMLEENAPIEYDQSSGTITLKEEVDFR